PERVLRRRPVRTGAWDVGPRRDPRSARPRRRNGARGFPSDRDVYRPPRPAIEGPRRGRRAPGKPAGDGRPSKPETRSRRALRIMHRRPRVRARLNLLTVPVLFNPGLRDRQVSRLASRKPFVRCWRIGAGRVKDGQGRGRVARATCRSRQGADGISRGRGCRRGPGRGRSRADQAPRRSARRTVAADAGGSRAVSDLHWLGAAEAARAIATRELSPVELTEALLRRIERLDPKLHAFIRLDAEAAMEAAKAAEAEVAAGRPRGPLHGVPVGIKDIIDVAGLPTTCHSKILIDHVAAADAVCVEKLRGAGAIVL